ncbi:MAG: hypothetical protein HY557_07005 [Euryarchaeota archaeon]|nr:hypothetical protein [Euryarchaeota archaeon]
MAWYAYQGPYAAIGSAWQTFMTKVHAQKIRPIGPPGDVYVCDPDDRKADGGAKLTTILWALLE